MDRIIISYKDNIDPVTALERVSQVIKQDKVSQVKDTKQYCFATVWKDGIVVYTRAKYNLKSDSFVVYREINNKNKKVDFLIETL